jgi:hypothetical protein
VYYYDTPGEDSTSTGNPKSALHKQGERDRKSADGLGLGVTIVIVWGVVRCTEAIVNRK